jgi:hypothetical protein
MPGLGWRVGAVAVTALGVAALAGAGASAPPPRVAAATSPSYEVAWVGEPIEVDGRPDEEAWRQAAALRFVHSIDGTPAPASLETRAKVLYDDAYLYFAFENADPNVWSTFTERDQHLWTEEVVEVFLQPDPAHPAYIELEVNPLGTMLDIFLIDVREPIPYASWNSAGLRWAVSVDGSVDGEAGDTGWSVEIALPVEEAVTAPHRPPRPGDRWRANFYRVESRPARAGLAWSPTLVGDFHRPERFGELVFGDRQLP